MVKKKKVLKRVKPNENVLTLKIAPFNYKIYVILSDNVEDARVRRSYLLGPYTPDGSTAGLHYGRVDLPISYVFLPYCSDIGYVAHETYHCICNIMEWAGARHEEEIVAYMMGYLVREITRFIGKHSEKGLTNNKFVVSYKEA